MFDQTQIKQLIHAPEQAWYECPHQTCMFDMRLSRRTNIAHQTREQRKVLSCLIERLMAFKFYQTRHKALDKREMFGDQLNTIKHCLVTKHFTVWCCLIVFDFVWSCLIKFEGHQTFDQNLKTFPLFSCLMGDVLFVWTAAYQLCFMRTCIPRLFRGLYQLFDLCLIKHVLTVWPLTSTLACLVTKQCLMVFGRQGPNANKHDETAPNKVAKR